MGDISANAVFQKTSTAPDVSTLESRLATIAESQRLIAELLNSRTACVSPAAGIAIPELRAHADKSILSTGIVGMGNSAHALAAYLSAAGCSVRMLTRDKVKAEHLDLSRQIFSEDRILGRFELSGAYTDARAFSARCKNIFVATVATAYREVAASLAPHLNSSHTIILFSGKFGGAREFQLELIDKGLKDLPKIVETDSLFACRLVAPERVWIRGIKRWTLFSSVTRSQTQACAPLVNAYFPGLTPADNLVQRGLTDFGALAHAPIALTNMHAIDREEEFLFYYQLHHRFFYEDVACSLVPFEQLAKLAAKETPILSSMISLATCVVGEDFRKTGRTLENLKLGDFNQSEIIQLLHS